MWYSLEWLRLNFPWTQAFWGLIAVIVGGFILWLFRNPSGDEKENSYPGWPAVTLGTILLLIVMAMLSPWWLSTLTIIGILAIGFNPWLPFIPLYLAQFNLFWTTVTEGTAKVVLRMGKYDKTLLAKKGHIVLEEKGARGDEGDIVPTVASDWEYKSGLRWVGIPPFWYVYTTTMKYIKALPRENKDGNMYEEREHPNTDYIFAKVDYQYALLFDSAEDKDKLPLSGQITMTARVINPEKAFFRVGNWYNALVSRVLPRVREYISEHTYDAIIHDPDVQLDEAVLKALKTEKVDDKERTIIQVLEQDYGMQLVALEMVDINPPDNYRDATLRKWNAEQNAAAEAEETGGALNRMTDGRLRKLAVRLGFKDETDDAFRKQLKDNPKILARIEAQSIDLLRRDRAGAGLKDIRVGNVDGSKLDSLGAFVLSAIGSWRGGTETGTKSASSETAPTSGSRKLRNNPSTGASEALEQQAEAEPKKSLAGKAQTFFEERGVYPTWDPLKRKPN